jgi:hypothetical protein
MLATCSFANEQELTKGTITSKLAARLFASAGFFCYVAFARVQHLNFYPFQKGLYR